MLACILGRLGFCSRALSLGACKCLYGADKAATSRQEEEAPKARAANSSVKLIPTPTSATAVQRRRVVWFRRLARSESVCQRRARVARWPARLPCFRRPGDAEDAEEAEEAEEASEAREEGKALSAIECRLNQFRACQCLGCSPKR